MLKCINIKIKITIFIFINIYYLCYYLYKNTTHEISLTFFFSTPKFRLPEISSSMGHGNEHAQEQHCRPSPCSSPPEVHLPLGRAALSLWTLTDRVRLEPSSPGFTRRDYMSLGLQKLKPSPEASSGLSADLFGPIAV